MIFLWEQLGPFESWSPLKRPVGGHYCILPRVMPASGPGPISIHTNMSLPGPTSGTHFNAGLGKPEGIQQQHWFAFWFPFFRPHKKLERKNKNSKNKHTSQKKDERAVWNPGEDFQWPVEPIESSHGSLGHPELCGRAPDLHLFVVSMVFPYFFRKAVCMCFLVFPVFFPVFGLLCFPFLVCLFFPSCPYFSPFFGRRTPGRAEGKQKQPDGLRLPRVVFWLAERVPY